MTAPAAFRAVSKAGAADQPANERAWQKHDEPIIGRSAGSIRWVKAMRRMASRKIRLGWMRKLSTRQHLPDL